MNLVERPYVRQGSTKSRAKKRSIHQVCEHFSRGFSLKIGVQMGVRCYTVNSYNFYSLSRMCENNRLKKSSVNGVALDLQLIGNIAMSTSDIKNPHDRFF